MKETPHSNPKDVAIAIRNQFSKGIPEEEAYKTICKTVGDNSITYKDFDFWWFRFSSGNDDLNTEPPKTRDFIDFPDNVLDEIIGKLEYTSRCTFRRTSKRNRRAVDNNLYVINKFHFISSPTETKLQIDGKIFFHYQSSGNFNKNVTRTENLITIRSKDYMELAMKELIFAIGQPNHRVKKLSILVEFRRISENIEQELQSLNRKIHVEHFKFDIDYELKFDGEESFHSDDSDEDELEFFEGQNQVLKVIPYLEPGVLEHIELSTLTDKYCIFAYPIAETEQWKRASQLTAGNRVHVEIEDLANFKNIFLSELEDQKLVELKNILRNSPNFEFCRIETCSGEYMRLFLMSADRFRSIDGSIIQVDSIDNVITFKKIH